MPLERELNSREMGTTAEMDALITRLEGIINFTNSIRAQFLGKSMTREEKDTVLAKAAEIDTSTKSTITAAKKIKKVLDDTEATIKSTVTAALHTNTKSIRPMYSSIAANSNNKKTVNKNRIIIKTDNAEKFDQQLKQKVSPEKEKVKVTFYKKLNNNTCIINTASKEESEKLTKIIAARIPEAKVQQERLLDPTICIFRCNNVSEKDVETHFVDAFGIKPTTTTKVTGPKASRIYVRCSAELYKLLPVEKRIRILWESLAFEDAVNPRFCRKCQRFGHVEKFCKAEDRVIQFVNDYKEATCTNCLHSSIAKQCQYKNIASSLANKELVGKCIDSIDHVTNNKNCPHYQKAVENLRAKTDFGS